MIIEKFRDGIRNRPMAGGEDRRCLLRRLSRFTLILRGRRSFEKQEAQGTNPNNRRDQEPMS